MRPTVSAVRADCAFLFLAASAALLTAATLGFARPAGSGTGAAVLTWLGVLLAMLGGWAVGRRPMAGVCIAGGGLALILGQVPVAGGLLAAGVAAARRCVAPAGRDGLREPLRCAAAMASVALGLACWERAATLGVGRALQVQIGLSLVLLASLALVWVATADGGAAAGLGGAPPQMLARAARRSYWGAAGAAALFALLWAAVIWRWSAPLDLIVDRTAYLVPSAPAHGPVQAFSDLGGRDLVLLWLPLLGVTLWRLGRMPVLRFLVVALGGAVGWEALIKNVALRARPDHGHRIHLDSFPSGHVLAATVLAGVMVVTLLPGCRRPWQRVALVGGAAAWPALTAAARVWLGRHYLTDVLAALCLGAAWVLACRGLILSLALVAGEDSVPARSAGERPQ